MTRNTAGEVAYKNGFEAGKQVAVAVLRKLTELPEEMRVRAIAAVNAAQTDDVGNQWISVEDRLPEKRQWVAVWNRVMGYDIDGIGDDGRWLLTTDPITHWMPLPDPPKEE